MAGVVSGLIAGIVLDGVGSLAGWIVFVVGVFVGVAVVFSLAVFHTRNDSTNQGSYVSNAAKIGKAVIVTVVSLVVVFFLGILLDILLTDLFGYEIVNQTAKGLMAIGLFSLLALTIVGTYRTLSRIFS